MKKNLLFSAILMMGLAIVGCGSVAENEGNLVKQNVDDNRENTGMEADAPKTSENQDTQNKESVKSGVEHNEITDNGNIGTQNQQSNNANVNKTEITEAEAKNIALKHAQISEAEVKKLRIAKERDDGRQIYDIDFLVGNMEYDYDIDLYTGEILSIDYDMEDDFYSNQNIQTNGQEKLQQTVQQNIQQTTKKESQKNTEKVTQQTTEKESQKNTEKVTQQTTQKETQQNNQSEVQTSNLISKAEAIAIALKKVSGATEKNVEIELDEDDGKWMYEGEIHYKGREYEFEINAKNGKIIEWSEDVDD